MSDNRREALPARLYRRFRLWHWNMLNADVLAFAVRRQTANLGHGFRCPRLQAVIDDLERQRALISETPKGETP
ncbi:MAG: hypothetical protein ABJP24_14025 [Marinomonas sp.]|uniref:hypothetical protein n=1 Tax=Sulfitobacter TaxID=60136 RepID=UPI00327BB9D7